MYLCYLLNGTGASCEMPVMDNAVPFVRDTAPPPEFDTLKLIQGLHHPGFAAN